MGEKSKDLNDKPLGQIDVRAGEYSDGQPLHEVNYIDCKIILRGERFTCRQSFFEFGRLVTTVAEMTKVHYETAPFARRRPRIREVRFFDTRDCQLYNNAFILRRRTTYRDGFPVGDPEIVFKFRHTDLQTAAEMDVRPIIEGKHKVKFKTQTLPLKDKVGGFRQLFSHNVQFPLSAVPVDRADIQNVLTEGFAAFGAPPDPDHIAMSALVEILPALQTLKLKEEHARVEFVNHTTVEEVRLNLGLLDFGKGIAPKAKVCVWRMRGSHRQTVAEFSFQYKFDRASEPNIKALARCTEFFCKLQQVAADWILLGTTKTGAVYSLNGGLFHALE